jgi:demethylmenaquinone methyltransferase / 2-methoxy-6-polyprenyl-1,4-benzoquinol methylase
MAGELSPGRTAPDGSPYPDRARPTFEREVRRMFSHIAARYEWFDHVASLGQDYLWRPRALWELDRFRRGPVRRALDVGCGTGELARALARRYRSAHVIASDFTRPMIERARSDRGARPLGERLAFVSANAARLPFADGAFDVVTNAFVARNLRDLAASFVEMRRVLRPEGVLLTLEITEPTSATMGRLFHSYFDGVVPVLGRAVGSEGPYRYLPESLRSLPSRNDLVSVLRRAGFPRVRAPTQSLGIVTTFLAEAGPSPDQSR